MDDKILDKVLIEVINIKEQLKNIPTKDEMNLRFDEAATNVDRFTKLHETLNQELAMLRSKYNRLEDRVVVLEQRLAVA